MPSHNRVQLMGNLTRDPELRYTQNETPVANFGLAVNRIRSKNEAVDFFDVTVWRETAKAAAEHKKKGDPVFIEGRLEQQNYTDKQGNDRSKHVVVAETIQYLSGGNGNGSGGGSGAGSAQSGEFSAEDFDEIPDDIPFAHYSSRRRIATQIL